MIITPEEILLHATGVIEIILILYLLNTKFPPKLFPRVEPTCAVLICAIVTRIPVITSSDLLQPLVLAILLMIHLCVFRKGNWHMKLFWTIFSVGIVLVIMVICNSFFLLFFRVSRDSIQNQPAFVQLQLIIFSKLVQAILFYLLAQNKTSNINMPWTVAIILSIIPLFSIVILLVILDYSMAVPGNAVQNLLMVVASLGMLIINICIFFLYIQMSQLAGRIVEQQISLQQSALKQTHYKEVQSIYDELKSWRHDYHNHLQALKGMLINSNYDLVDQYISSIDSSISEIEAYIWTGNELLDAILNAKISHAHANNINIEVGVGVDLPASIDMESMDLCSLIGNLLDNAIEACQRMNPARSNFISMGIYAVKGNLVIEIKNSTDGVFNKKGSKFFTVKESRFHGVGLKQIDAIVEKYNGNIDRDYDENVFKTIVSIPVCSVVARK